MERGDLTDQQWQQLEPLLPAQKPRTGRPGKDHRTIINGILWVLRTGAPWRDLPERMALGVRWPAGFTGGASRDYGNGCWLRHSSRLTLPDRTGKSITWTVPWFGRISTLLGQKRGRRPSVRAFTRGLWHESPCTGGGPGPAGSLRSDPGAAA